MSSQELLDQKVFDRFYRHVQGGHATTYLVTGHELEKKKALAVAFAKALNCSEGVRDLSCSCGVCRRIEAGTHPDVRWYGRDEETNSIKISEIRDFKNWLHLKAFEGKVKVFIFNEAERLGPEAQNALLKSIEEPPPGNVILFLLPHAQLLFDTISSLDVEIRVPACSTERIRELLVREGVLIEQAECLARMSQGHLTRARKAASEGWFRKKNEWLEDLVNRPGAFFESFEPASREAMGSLLDFLIEWLRDLLVFSASGEAGQVIHIDRLELIQSMTARCDFQSLLELFDHMNQLRRSIDDYANRKLVLTQVGMCWERSFRS